MTRKMSRDDPGGMHFFEFWAARAKDPTLPLWLRIVALAYSSHTKNGHATFVLAGESTLPEVLNKDKRHIQNEINRAVKRGFLAAESNIRCLVLPDGVTGGAEGDARSKCKLH